MLDVPRQMYRGVPSSTYGTLVSVPTGVTWIVRSIVLTNVSTSAVTATLLLGGITVVYQLSIPVNNFIVVDFNQVLTTGQAIAGNASANSALAVGIAGIEVAL